MIYKDILKRVLLISTLCAALFANPSMEQNASLVVQVGDQDQAARQLIQQVESIGGYYLQWNEQEVVFRLPSDSLPSLIKQVEQMGRVIAKNYYTQDQTIAISNAQASIESRRKLLNQYFTMVKSSDSYQLKVVEQEIIRLIAQIEREEGMLRGMENRVREARLQVSFQFMDRSLPQPTGNSPFPWINTISLEQHREDF